MIENVVIVSAAARRPGAFARAKTSRKTSGDPRDSSALDVLLRVRPASQCLLRHRGTITKNRNTDPMYAQAISAETKGLIASSSAANASTARAVTGATTSAGRRCSKRDREKRRRS